MTRKISQTGRRKQAKEEKVNEEEERTQRGWQGMNVVTKPEGTLWWPNRKGERGSVPTSPLPAWMTWGYRTVTPQ